MTEPQFVTNTKGERVGVLLDIETYQQLLQPSESLTGLSLDALRALASTKLEPQTQHELSDLTSKSSLSKAEQTRLDTLLTHIDQLNTLKARAKLTLAKLEH